MPRSFTNPLFEPLLYVVDDEEDMRRIIDTAAKTVGYQTKSFADASSLFRHLKTDPDVIVLDLGMPDIDGVEVIRTLSAMACNSAIIIMSGFDERLLNSIGHLAAELKLNLLGLLRKPFQIDSFLRLLQKPPALAQDRTQPRPNFSHGELSKALSDDQLIVHYQPQVCFADQRWCGLEALVRWQHPVYGLLAPNQFIEFFEQEGLISELTQQVLQKTLREFEYFKQLDFHGSVSINLPGGALGRVDFPDTVIKNFNFDGIAHGLITFELTETSIAENKTHAADILTRLRLKGFHLAIDDFGTGYSSLEALHKLPFNELKIDKQFVQSATSDNVAKVIVQHSIELARHLNMQVVAEGVETQEQWDWLLELGCDIAQGYYISRPHPAFNLMNWLSEWNSAKSIG